MQLSGTPGGAARGCGSAAGTDTWDRDFRPRSQRIILYCNVLPKTRPHPLLYSMFYKRFFFKNYMRINFEAASEAGILRITMKL